MKTKESMRLKIVSDGTSYGTKVIDLDTGRVLPVRALSFSVDAQTCESSVLIVVPAVECDLTGIAAEVVKEREREAGEATPAGSVPAS